MTIQTTYQDRMDAFRAGMIQGSDYDTKTGVVETEAGIGFGLAVGQGAEDNGVVLGGALGGFRGVSVRDVTQEVNRSTGVADTYPQYANMSYLTRGLIAVVPLVNVVAGDPVHYNTTTGRFTNTGGSGQVLGARWATSASAGGYALLDMGGYNQN